MNKVLLFLEKAEPGSKVFIDNKKVRVSDEGFFAFGLDRDRKNDVIIKVQKYKKLQTIYKKVFKERV